MILCSSCGQFGTHVGCTSWPTNPPYLLCPACLPAHESSQHTASATEAVKFNQGGAKTRPLAASKPGLLGKSTTNARKGMCLSRSRFCFGFINCGSAYS